MKTSHVLFYCATALVIAGAAFDSWQSFSFAIAAGVAGLAAEADERGNI